ncbi:glycosyltransferase, partial [Vibrio parahaemolyticus]
MDFISIVTVNFNDSNGLKKTLESITKQKSFCKSLVQLIVIDGGSNDGSLEVIHNYKDALSIVLSEPDEGIYDAMNKGLEYCRGTHVLFLNSGDYFCTDNALTVLYEQIRIRTDSVIFWPVSVVSDKTSWYYPNVSKLDIPSWLKKHLPNHQAMLFPRSFYNKNKYDLSIPISSDADYKIRSLSYNDYFYLDSPLTAFVLGGVSSKPLGFNRYMLLIRDSNMLNNKHYNGFLLFKTKAVFLLKLTVKLVISIFFRSGFYYRVLSIINK